MSIGEALPLLDMQDKLSRRVAPTPPLSQLLDLLTGTGARDFFTDLGVCLLIAWGFVELLSVFRSGARLSFCNPCKASDMFSLS